MRGRSLIIRMLPGAATGSGRGAARSFLSVHFYARLEILRATSKAFPRRAPPSGMRSRRRASRTSGRQFMEFLASSRLTREDILSGRPREGEENFAARARAGKGRLPPRALRQLGARRHPRRADRATRSPRSSGHSDNPLLERRSSRYRRTRLGQPGHRARRTRRARSCRPIRDKRPWRSSVDQNVIAEEAVFVPFFGRPAATTPSLALLQMKTDARGRAGLHVAARRGRYSPAVRDAHPGRRVRRDRAMARRGARPTSHGPLHGSDREGGARRSRGLALDAQPLADEAGGELELSLRSTVVAPKLH